MKIMLISGEYPPRIGGVADYTCHLAQALARIGHHVSVLTTANGRSDGWAMEAGDHVEVYRDVRDWGVRGAASISARVRDLTPDVIDFQYVPHMYGRGGFAPGAAILPLRLRRLSSATIVSTVHEIASPWSLKPRRAFAAAAHRVQALLLAIASDRCIVTNQRYARQIRKWARSGSALHEIPVGAGIEPVPLSEPATSAGSLDASTRPCPSSSINWRERAGRRDPRAPRPGRGRARRRDTRAPARPPAPPAR